jgi:hypothetical protein
MSFDPQVPILFFLFLYSNRGRLNPRGKSVKEAMAMRAQDTRVRSYGFLWADYRPSCWWFECLETVRRLFLTGTLVLCYPGSVTQVLLGMAIAFASSRLFGYFSPFVSRWKDILMDYTQFCTLMTLCLTLWIKLGGDKYSRVIGGKVDEALIAVNVSVVGVMAFTTVMEVREALWQAREREREKAKVEPEKGGARLLRHVMMREGTLPAIRMEMTPLRRKVVATVPEEEIRSTRIAF